MRSYLLAEMVEADHASRGWPSGDVFRAKSSTVVSIFFRVGSSALVSPATSYPPKYGFCIYLYRHGLVNAKREAGKPSGQALRGMLRPCGSIETA